MPDNRRSTTRHEVSIECQLTVDGAVTECTIINLSLGGALIENLKQPMGKRVNVAFAVPAQEGTIEIGGTVRWSDAKGTGIQFDGLRARDVWALNEYFKLLS